MKKIILYLICLIYLSFATMRLKVVVRSNPAGAEIYCNGEYLGSKPQVIKKKTNEDQKIEAVLGEFRVVKVIKPEIIQWYSEALDRTKEALKVIAGKEGVDYNEIIIDLNGSLEVQAFKVERGKEENKK